MRPRPTEPIGLYDPAFEHDACGVGFVVRLDGVPTHEAIERGLRALANLEHRGAAGADAKTGDGAGILLQMPDRFVRAMVGDELPPLGQYGVGVCFLPRDDGRRAELERLLEQTVEAEGQRVIAWRDIPVDDSHVGTSANAYAPRMRQLVVGASPELAADGDAFERKLYVIRRVAELAAGPDLALPSFSSRTLVYKGMLTAPQLPGYFPDLRDELMESALVLVHSRYSTNTFPSWELAHPYRMIAHNGEINTLRGNVNWMRARESQLASELFGDDLAKVLPVVRPGGSDTANFDNVLELLVLGGRSIPHAMMMMIPEAYQGRDDLSAELKGFYAYHQCLMEAWDGPAAIAFTDGRVIGATLDRNGLRPGRWLETKDGWVVLASETGVLDEPAENILRKGRLQPGKLFLVDLERGRIVEDEEIKHEIATRRPYAEWYEQEVVRSSDLPEREPQEQPSESLRARLLAFGYSQEDMKVILAPLARNAEEAVGSMGNDSPLAVLSDRKPLMYSYFKQLFAQVTNPPVDSIREAVVMSVQASVGSERNLLDETPEHARQLVIENPILLDSELERLRQVDSAIFKSRTLDITWAVAEGPGAMEPAIERVCREADAALADGVNILILSDRAVGPERAQISSALAVAAVHHHLVREGTRLQAGLIVESGEARSVQSVAILVGYGAAAVNPYLMLETLGDLARRGELDMAPEEAQRRAVKGIAKGLLKTMSKMGISTIPSYCGAQIFEILGLAPELVDRYFTGTPSRIGGIGIETLAEEMLARHARAYPGSPEQLLPVVGLYAWRRDGEFHQWNPESIALLQHAVRDGGFETYEQYAQTVNADSARQRTIRGLLSFRFAEDGGIPLDEVEPASEIVKRFVTGAMSLGSLSREAHETLAIAMNRLGGRSNTGEGGEDPARYVPDENGDSRRSSIKQVASGRFGVNIDYLTNADELQIKMAQGAKPGEGGQLPGHKVDTYIASVRLTTPGVGLISPPPHHDIYSIEDLKQLIYDLRCANPEARISVKLVAEVGVGTVAAGVAKANADHVLISGHDGGTGASPLSSILFAGIPWEIGLAETQQTLVLNDLRSRIWVQTDGQLKTGRDVVVAALLGADEMGFATAPLIATGCVMMRACHLNTCPVGVATQDPELRKRFKGQPEHVVNFFFYVAEEARQIMARLGIRRFEDLVGRVDLLEADQAMEHWRERGIDLSNVLRLPDGAPLRRTSAQASPLADALDWRLIEVARPAIEQGTPVSGEAEIRNVNRTVGGLLSHEVTKRYGARGLPPGTVRFSLTGSAGQSFGAWLAPGIELTLFGDTNDYAGKGLSGGTIAVRPPAAATFAAEDNVIVGNTVLYGAVAGEAFFRGRAGERFAVRNSGANAVVEGVGDHGCEYMTGGRVVVLGPTGRNFAAGMSGGIAYVLDPERTFASRCNLELVELEPLEEDDVDTIRSLVGRHHDLTGSPVAARVLDQWELHGPLFAKVMPRDYKRALAALNGYGNVEDVVSSGGGGFLTTESERAQAAV